MKAVVSGGAGFIGSHVVDELLCHGFEVCVIDNLITGSEKNVSDEATLHKVDVRDESAVKEISIGCDYFFHLAAAMPVIKPPFEDVAEHIDTNITGTVSCLKAAASVGAKKFLYASSTAVYGQARSMPITEDSPLDLLSRPYTIQKLAGEQHALLLAERFGIDVVSLRLFANYGPRSVNSKKGSNVYSPVIGIFLSQKLNGLDLTITGVGDQTRDFVYVKDTARIFVEVSKDERITDGVYNVCTGRAISIQDLANLISDKQVYIPRTYGEVENICGSPLKLGQLGIKTMVSVEEGVALLEAELRKSL